MQDLEQALEKALKPVSFNEWLFTSPFRGFADKWVPRRGRLTRESVEKRAQLEYGFEPGEGTKVWDAYCRDTKRPIVAKALPEGSPNPPVYTAAQGA